MVTGRFAPSPTGPLHLGSLVAAVGSWLFARQVGGRWLVRMEDLDTPRVVAGSADEILSAIERFGLAWDGDVVYQSQRTSLYDDALAALRARNLVYDCGCSRADLQRAASAPLGREPVYP
ncbi:MAG TPA: glutamate--tRNA ligase family protein, partial [Thermoanaerobaculia bacterium]|nr:glutamate--tRNA ligase family protein [Thermoanaerobaculia bacterium]